MRPCAQRGGPGPGLAQPGPGASRSGQGPSSGLCSCRTPSHTAVFPTWPFQCSAALLGGGEKGRERSWMASSGAFGGCFPTCPESGCAIGGGESPGAGVQAPVLSWHVAQALRASGPFALRRLIKGSRVPLGFEAQMRMCFEIFKLGNREFRPNEGLREAGGGVESETQ